MLSANAEKPQNTEIGGRLAKYGAFQHLLKQALVLKEEESLGILILYLRFSHGTQLQTNASSLENPRVS